MKYNFLNNIMNVGVMYKYDWKITTNCTWSLRRSTR